MATQPDITQRDLRTRAKEIMDAVQAGQPFTITRDGHRIGEFVPLRRRRRFVPRSEFAAMSRPAPDISLDAFRADQDATAEQSRTAPMPVEHGRPERKAGRAGTGPPRLPFG